MMSIAEELNVSFGESRFLELLISFPTRNELDSILTFASVPKTDEEALIRSHLVRTSEILKEDHDKRTDPRLIAEAEKEYAKKMKKLPRAVVKKHVNNRIKPLLSPILRAAEQCFVVCAVFDVIGVLNYIRRKNNVNEEVEAWWPGAVPQKLTPVEIMSKFWVHSDVAEERVMLACFVEYSRSVLESDCVEALSALLHAGATVSNTAKEFAADKGPILKSLLEEKKAPSKIMTVKKKESATNEQQQQQEEHEAKRKFKFGSKKEKEEKKPSKLTFGRSKTTPITSGTSGTSGIAGEPPGAAAVGAESDESSD
jgi:hypothetical protein